MPGCAPGDLLLAINDNVVSSLEQVPRVIDQKPRRMALLIQREGQRIGVPVELD